MVLSYQIATTRKYTKMRFMRFTPELRFLPFKLEMCFITLHYNYIASYCLAWQVPQWSFFSSGLVVRFFMFSQRCFHFLVLLFSVSSSNLTWLIREITAVLYRLCRVENTNMTECTQEIGNLQSINSDNTCPGVPLQVNFR